MAADTLTIYLKKLGVEPGATLEEINAAYYRLIESVAENGSEQDAQRMLDLQHAYAVVRRAYEGDDVRERREAHLRSARTRRVVRATGVLGGALAILLLLFNFSGLRMAFGGFEPGTSFGGSMRRFPTAGSSGTTPSTGSGSGSPSVLTRSSGTGRTRPSG